MKPPSIRIIALIAASLAFLFPASSQAAKTPANLAAYKTVAVWVKIDPKIDKTWWFYNDPDFESSITATMQGILLDKGYEVLDRSKAASTAVETEKAMTEAGVTEGAPQGAAIGAKGMFVVTLISVTRKSNGGTANVGIQLLDVKDKKVLWAGTGSYNSDTLAHRLTSHIGAGVVGGAVGRTTNSGVAGGVAGTVTGDQIAGDKALADVIQEAVKDGSKKIPSQPSK